MTVRVPSDAQRKGKAQPASLQSSQDPLFNVSRATGSHHCVCVNLVHLVIYQRSRYDVLRLHRSDALTNAWNEADLQTLSTKGRCDRKAHLNLQSYSRHVMPLSQRTIKFPFVMNYLIQSQITLKRLLDFC